MTNYVVQSKFEVSHFITKTLQAAENGEANTPRAESRTFHCIHGIISKEKHQKENNASNMWHLNNVSTKVC